jgi:hypothetical protein
MGLVHLCTDAGEMLKLIELVQSLARVAGIGMRSAYRFGISRSDRKIALSAIEEPHWTASANVQ